MKKSVNTRIVNRIVGSDYSGQELRLAAYLSQDKKLLDAYANNLDAYAIIAQQIFNCKYEDCLEFYPAGVELLIDGKKVITGNKTHINPDGKAKRSTGKTMVLAGNYGMSGGGAGALMGKSAKEGSELLKKYFMMFPGLSNAISNSKELLKKNGYVEDIAGRRRRLPDIYLAPYEVFYKDPAKQTIFNPFLNCKDTTFQDQKLATYLLQANHCHNNREYIELAKQALKEDIIIKANTAKIAQAERQCFNARIQGSAGTLTKKAMIDIFNDPELKSYNAHLIITVHDEVLVECPEFYSKAVEKRLSEVMVNAANELGIINPKMKCDPYNVSRWYSNESAASLLKEYNKLCQKVSPEKAKDIVISNHKEVPSEAILQVLGGKTDTLDFD